MPLSCMVPRSVLAGQRRESSIAWNALSSHVNCGGDEEEAGRHMGSGEVLSRIHHARGTKPGSPQLDDIVRWVDQACWRWLQFSDYYHYIKGHHDGDVPKVLTAGLPHGLGAQSCFRNPEAPVISRVPWVHCSRSVSKLSGRGLRPEACGSLCRMPFDYHRHPFSGAENRRASQNKSTVDASRLAATACTDAVMASMVKKLRVHFN